jgi:hypothetical protein
LVLARFADSRWKSETNFLKSAFAECVEKEESQSDQVMEMEMALRELIIPRKAK